LQILIAILGTLGSVVLVAAVIIFGETFLLEGFVSPAAGVEIQGWLDEFISSQIFALSIGAVLALVWHSIAFKSSGRKDDHRVWWVVIWVLCLMISLVLLGIQLPDTEEGISYAYLMAFVNGLLAFWLATVWCTPGACKYAPMGAGKMRGLFKL
jgi:hypothetical protein